MQKRWFREHCVFIVDRVGQRTKFCPWTHFIGETLNEKMLISKMNVKKVGFVSILSGDWKNMRFLDTCSLLTFEFEIEKKRG